MEHRDENLALGNSIIGKVCELLLETDESLEVEVGCLRGTAQILQVDLLDKRLDVISLDFGEVLPNLEIV